MSGKSHPWDSIADEVQQWMETESQFYVDALMGNSRAPFAAQTSEADKMDYYRRQMFMANPDGSINFDQPNLQGRQQLMQRLGVSGYTQVAHAVKPPQGFRQITGGNPTSELTPPEPDTLG